MTTPEKTIEPPRLRRTAVALALIFLIDLGYIGQGGIALIVAVLGTLLLSLGCAWSLIRGRRPLAVSRAIRGGLYVLLGAAAVGAMALHARTGRINADRVIEACRSYERANGKLPDRLEDLVPDFLPSIPRARYTGMFREFMYWSTGEGHTLLYVTVPPFGRRLYHFEERRWSSLD